MICFDTTVLWGAFLRPAGPNWSLLSLAAQRSPVLDGFVTDAIGAEFWWRATQQGVNSRGSSDSIISPEDVVDQFLDTFGVLFAPEHLARAPLGRTLGQYASLVGLPLAQVLAHITGRDRQALLASAHLQFPFNFESVDVADLHVIAGALEGGAVALCTSGTKTLALNPIGPMRTCTPIDLADDLGLINRRAIAPID